MRPDRWIRRAFDADTRQLIANTVTLQTSVAVILPLNVLQSIALARALGPAGLGTSAPLIALVRIASQICDVGPAQLVVVFSPRYRQVAGDTRYAALLKLTALISLASGFCAAALATLLLLGLSFTGWSGGRLIQSACYLAAAAIFVEIGGLVQTILCAKQRFVAATSLRVASAIVSLCIVSGTAIVTRNESAVIIAYAVADILIAATAWVVLLVLLPRVDAIALHVAGLRQLAPDWVEMRRYVGLSWLSSTTLAGLSRADEFLASFLASPEAIGFYKIAKNAIQIAQALTSAMLEAAFVDVSSFWASRALDRVRTAVRNLTIGGVLFAAGGSLAIVLFGRQVIALLYGPEFVGAYPLAIVLAVGMWCLPVLWLHALLRVAGRLHVLVIAEGVATTAAVLIMFAAGQAWGITGVAIGRVSFDIVFSLVGLIFTISNRAMLFGGSGSPSRVDAVNIPAPSRLMVAPAREGASE